MIELDVNLYDLTIRQIEGYAVQLEAVRVFVTATDESNWTVEGLQMEGMRGSRIAGGKMIGADWKFVTIDKIDPLYPVLMEAVVTYGSKLIAMRIHDALYDLRGERARDGMRWVS